MRCVCRSGPEFLAVFPSSNARRYDVRTEIPGGISQFKWEAFFGRGRNFCRFCPVCARGVFRSEPKFLAKYSSVNARRLSARPEIPGDIYQFGCVRVFQSGPNFLVIFPRSNAMSFSVRTKVPGDFPQDECEAFFGQNQNSLRYFQIRMRGVVWSGPKFLAACPSLNAKRFLVRTEIPGDISQFEFAASFGQNQNPWRRFPV